MSAPVSGRFFPPFVVSCCFVSRSIFGLELARLFLKRLESKGQNGGRIDGWSKSSLHRSLDRSVV